MYLNVFFFSLYDDEKKYTYFTWHAVNVLFPHGELQKKFLTLLLHSLAQIAPAAPALSSDLLKAKIFTLPTLVVKNSSRLISLPARFIEEELLV